MIALEILVGTAGHHAYEFHGAAVRLGRAPVNDVSFTDYHLSSEHAVVARQDDGYVFRDLRSTNGSMIERGPHRIPVDATVGFEVALASGDVLALGDRQAPVRIRVRFAEAGVGGGGGGEPDIDGDEDPDGAGDSRVIASRSLVDLRRVAEHVEHNPANALRIYKALQPLGSRLDMLGVCDATIDAAFELLPRATNVAVLLRADDAKARFAHARSRARGDVATTVRASRAVLKQVIHERAAVLLANAREQLAASESVISGKIISIVAVPLWRGDEITGLLQIDNRDAGARNGWFDEHDLEVALLLGAQASLAFDNATLVGKLQRAEEQLRGENSYLKARSEAVRFDNIIGESPAMRAVIAQLEKVIATRATVCIEGETGTGKELVASAIHYQSPRRDKMFVAQNCAALPENLLESELFGHRRGAFTSADSDKKGLFEIADGGTLFLDEMGEMPMALQAKLLRVLQEGSIRPVGATSEKSVDVRIICATNRDLRVEVEQGRFRQDLFYRLMVFPLKLPPLRDRREDIPLLAETFLRRYCAEYHLDVPGFTDEAISALSAYAWPGNIRELENEVQRLIIQAEPGHALEITDLSPRLRQIEGTVSKVAPQKGTLKDMMDQVERWLLLEALRDHGNNKTRTAVTLGITREGLHKKLAKFGL